MDIGSNEKKRVIFHIDMDAFFASCEEAINPKLREKPLVVGGTKKDLRGIVTCPNYKARKLGVKTAMPLFKAIKLAPDAVFIRGTRGLYGDYSKKVRVIFENYTSQIQPISIDEAYMDVTDVLFNYEYDAQKLAQAIKDEIKNTLDITCSIGISGTKLCSKIASDFNKPDGITYVEPGKEKEFLAGLKIERIPGVGKKLQEKLLKYNIEYIRDILKYDVEFYEREIGHYSSFLLRVANGVDNREVHTESGDRKSLSKETTLNENTDDIEFLKKQMNYLLERSCALMRKNGIKARTITVKVKYFDFKINQKSFTTVKYSNLEPDFYSDAVILLNKLMERGKKVRLIGVRFNELIDEDKAIQESLFYDTDKFEKITEKIDKIREKYNFNVIKFGKNF
ncbi:MAG: DNA polymerase IV [Ignavibacteriae bacterium]|nr:DNA polymerase IV [Ignavibacteriota bacterium]MCB9243488.1 DNA polymerase IV [Ignavibacteriales bacterium]